VEVFWGLDKKLAQRKHFPAINWNESFSNYEKNLKDYFAKHQPDFARLKMKFKNILSEE